MFVAIVYHVWNEACGALEEGVGRDLARYEGEEFESHDGSQLGVGPVWEPAIAVDLFGRKKLLGGEWEGYEGAGAKGVYVAFVADWASRED